MSEQVWLPLIRSSNSQTLGQAVLRLAELAEAAHLQQTTDTFKADSSDNPWADGPARQDVDAWVRGRDHTEVDR